MKLKIILLLVGFLALAAVFLLKNQPGPKTNLEVKQVPVQGSSLEIAFEITEIKATNNLDQQVDLYKKLIERVGPSKAQEQLHRSGLPFDGQSHLLNHTIGDWLYQKYGKEGLTLCKDYFLSSCYHGFVLRVAADGGVEALSEVMKTCWKKGWHVSIQCAHAIGHGLLAWSGYANLTAALARCDELLKISPDFPSFNCYDGTFMENIWAVHEDGKPSKDRWLKDDDPIYPCNDQRIDQKYINACWSNQPMRMYQMFGGDIQKVAAQCLNLKNQTYKTTCFDGLARQIHPTVLGSVDKTFQSCNLMPKEWVDPCLISVSRAFFSVGDKKIPFEICSRMKGEGKNSCWQGLSEIIASYAQNLPDEKKELCSKIALDSAKRKCSL